MLNLKLTKSDQWDKKLSTASFRVSHGIDPEAGNNFGLGIRPFPGLGLKFLRDGAESASLVQLLKKLRKPQTKLARCLYHKQIVETQLFTIITGITTFSEVKNGA